ncbi:protein MpCupin101 [Marchantia polymorpha subsp. ruderalis]|uniref:Germin-like protein n=1 Tax=Marchantia polymorpha TaxID=3197 RepID=A0A2R6XMU5_MARPO|nr:hypothetical protein MARPO_0008s0175 [Marchantia polymorpha]BBN19409.1 hypothetical protein Mp_8g10470 [Marchantia polymorpha subsp. ruderalis]|eukprot:PTQ47423.1 hypothetical protein MARPO_0008s0175 [Marchantia polymorpha]
MEFLASKSSVYLAIILLFYQALGRVVADMDLTDDFFIPPDQNTTSLNGKYFTYTGLRGFKGQANTFASRKATVKEFPALTSLGVSVMLLEFQPQAVNPPHTHPRASELMYMLDGILDVAFVDSTGKLYSETVRQGDLFVFPRGMVHHQFNNGTKVAKAVSSFGHPNPGTINLPITLFGTQIPNGVLKKSFKVDDQVIALLRSPYVKLITN